MPKILITGAGGFIGRNLAAHFCSRATVVAPSRSELDLLDSEAVRSYLRAQRFDVVIHSATVRSNRKIGNSPDLLDHNCRMFFNLVRNEAEFGRMLFLSSGAVYGREQATGVSESDFDGRVPPDAYGFSKYICAKALASTKRVYELRLFGVFGPHEDWQVRFISNACCRALWDLPVVLRQNVAFDYLDVADLARVLERLLDADLQFQHYNVCSGRTFLLLDLATLVLQASQKNLDIVVRAPGLGQEYSGQNARLLSEIGALGLTDMAASVHRLYHWYHDRKSVIDPALLHFDE